MVPYPEDDHLQTEVDGWLAVALITSVVLVGLGALVLASHLIPLWCCA